MGRETVRGSALSVLVVTADIAGGSATTAVNAAADALLATVQVPAATPVACVAVDGAESAGVLAARIINA